MTGGACATQGFGRLAVRPAQACAETSSRGIVRERSGSTHQVCGQFRDAVAECVATTRRRCPQGAIFSGPPEKTHPPARETPGPHLAPRSPSQWLPHGSMDDEASRGSDRKDLDRKSTRLNSSHRCISYAVFCLKKKNRKASVSYKGHRTLNE